MKGWLLRVRLDRAWEQCFFESRGEALDVAKALCDDYGSKVRDLQLVRADDAKAKRSFLVQYQKHYRS
jgi:hypothetical protein